MKVTKEMLQLFCKSLGIPATGNKSLLKARVCNELCNDNETESTKAITTLRGLLRKKKNEQVFEILKDIKSMLDDDTDIPVIVRSVGGAHAVKVEKNDVIVFAEVLDAYEKKDFSYIEEKLEDWGKSAKNGLLMLKVYANKLHLKDLADIV